MVKSKFLKRPQLLADRPFLFLLPGLFLLLSGCATGRSLFYSPDRATALKILTAPASFPAMRFAVISDPHLFSPSLGAPGKVLSHALERNPALLLATADIVRETLQRVLEEGVDFIIVCGDLTNEGERGSHELLAALLDSAEKTGIRIYVVPGNHDINNSRAVRFTSNRTESVPSVSPEEFAAIYRNFGYGEAIYRDPFSLSYVVEPVEGLWLLGVDSCRYRENRRRGSPTSGGRLYPETLDWLKGIFIRADREQKAVICFTHHNILEHYQGERRYTPNFMVEDSAGISRLFALYGSRLVFTGHMHSQDMVLESWEIDGHRPSLLEVETGSLTTFPCPYRIVSISEGQKFCIVTRYVTSLSSYPPDFLRQAYDQAYGATYKAIYRFLERMLIFEPGLSRLAEVLTRAAMVHFRGDEKEWTEPIDLDGLGLWPRFAARILLELLEDVLNDPAPADNELIMDLRTMTLSNVP